MYGFLEIIGWLWHGMLQLIRVVVPIIQPAPEPWSAPGWFTDVWPDWLWWYYLESDSRPTETWCHNYIYAARVQMQRWIERRSDQARDTALEWVRAFTGWVAHGYSTFQDWLEAIRERTGTWVPWWADSLADAASVLWLKLPDAIRYAWQTWDDIWEGIKSSVRDWVRATYDYLVSLGQSAWDWVLAQGDALRAWWESVRSWIGAFMADPYGTIVTWLGPTWTRLTTFATDCLDFWYNLWGSNGADIGGLLSDPLNWLYDRAEDLLIERWG